MTHEFTDSKLAYIRDLFVFASFTALSFVDIKELTTNDIVEANGEKWILSKRHKTKIPFQVKLLDIPLQIINRYKPFQENKLVFPNLNYWSICKPLKKMIKECGIDKDISFHTARHGFATLALSKGMPIESVSRVLGHTNIVTTQLYAKITTEKIDKDLTMFGKVIPHNADPTRTHLNMALVTYPDGVKGWDEAIAHRLQTACIKRKITNDQVRVVRIVMSGTHEDMMAIYKNGELGEWRQDSIRYLYDTFGRENVVSAHLHMNEKTPHIHASVVPIVTGERRKAKKRTSQWQTQISQESKCSPFVCR